MFKEVEKDKIFEYKEALTGSPWRLYIHVVDPRFSDGRSLSGTVPAVCRGRRLFPATGIDQLDNLEMVAARKYTCEID